MSCHAPANRSNIGCQHRRERRNPTQGCGPAGGVAQTDQAGDIRQAVGQLVEQLAKAGAAAALGHHAIEHVGRQPELYQGGTAQP